MKVSLIQGLQLLLLLGLLCCSIAQDVTRTTWTVCSRSCGGGIQTRRRFTGSGPPQVIRVSCNTMSCKSLHRWLPWSNCSRSCGGGIRNRELQNPAERNKTQKVLFSMPCGNNPCQPELNCGSLDLVFLLDSSGSVGAYNWDRIKQFTTDVVQSLEVGKDKIRIGMATFSNSPEIIFRLGDYSTKADILKAIWDARFQSGATGTAAGLKEVRTKLFVPEAGDRPEVQNVLVLITDGVSNLAKQRTLPEATTLKENGVIVFSLGIGLLVRGSEFRSIPSPPASWSSHFVSSVDKLPTLIPSLSYKLCAIGKPTCCSVSGNSWVHTFDSATFNYQGACKYNMATSASKSFSVYVKHGPGYGKDSASSIQYVEIIYNNHTIRLGKGKVVTVDSKPVDLPYLTREDIYIKRHERSILTTLPSGVTLSFDGVFAAKLCMTRAYHGNMTGLCGNYDSTGSNDHVTASGHVVPPTEEGFSMLGDSYQVLDKEDPGCFSPNVQPIKCSDTEKQRASSYEYCGFLRDKDGAFSACVSRMLLPGYAESCVSEVCSNSNNSNKEVLSKALACNTLQLAAEECKTSGVKPLNWESVTHCNHGVWTAWTDWSTCSADCLGTQQRHRKCLTPTCRGYSGEIRYCGDFDCEESDWTSWGSWDQCSTSCGNGTHTRRRQCLVDHCDGEEEDVGNCDAGPCPAPWGAWSEWSACSRSCGLSYKHRKRECSTTAISCRGETSERRTCQLLPCPGDVQATTPQSFKTTGTGFSGESERYISPGSTGSTSVEEPQSSRANHNSKSVSGSTPEMTSPTLGPKTSTVSSTTQQPGAEMTSPTLGPNTRTLFSTTQQPSAGTPCTKDGATFKVADDPHYYLWVMHGRDVKMPCAPGTLFSLQQCACVHSHVTTPGKDCYSNYTLYLPMDVDFKDKSCMKAYVEPVGNPSLQDSAGSFDGTSYLVVPAFAGQFDGRYLRELSISLWFRMTKQCDCFGGLFMNGDFDTRPSVDIHVDDQGKLNAGFNFAHFTPIQVELNRWYHVVSVFSGTTMSLYLDGDLRETKDTNGDTVRNTAFPVRIGTGNDGTRDGPFTGSIDEVIVAKRALGVEEIKLLSIRRGRSTEVPGYTYSGSTTTPMSQERSTEEITTPITPKRSAEETPSPTPPKRSTEATPSPTPPKRSTEATPSPTPPKRSTEATPSPTTPKRSTEATPSPITPKRGTEAIPSPITPQRSGEATPSPTPPKRSTEATPSPTTRERSTEATTNPTTRERGTKATTASRNSPPPTPRPFTYPKIS